MAKFCTKCGKELINDEKIGFSSETGEPIYHQCCPTNLCEHDGVGHEMVMNKRSISDRFLGTVTYSCRKCGLNRWELLYPL
jgi:hypothetical protein